MPAFKSKLGNRMSETAAVNAVNKRNNAFCAQPKQRSAELGARAASMALLPRHANLPRPMPANQPQDFSKEFEVGSPGWPPHPPPFLRLSALSGAAQLCSCRLFCLAGPPPAAARGERRAVRKRCLIELPPCCAGGDSKPQIRPKETDVHKLAQRQKQIDYGKNTLGYALYSSTIPKCVLINPSVAPLDPGL